MWGGDLSKVPVLEQVHAEERLMEDHVFNLNVLKATAVSKFRILSKYLSFLFICSRTTSTFTTEMFSSMFKKSIKCGINLSLYP